jgi:hypothetical protein
VRCGIGEHALQVVILKESLSDKGAGHEESHPIAGSAPDDDGGYRTRNQPAHDHESNTEGGIGANREAESVQDLRGFRRRLPSDARTRVAQRLHVHQIRVDAGDEIDEAKKC